MRAVRCEPCSHSHMQTTSDKIISKREITHIESSSFASWVFDICLEDFEAVCCRFAVCRKVLNVVLTRFCKFFYWIKGNSTSLKSYVTSLLKNLDYKVNIYNELPWKRGQQDLILIVQLELICRWVNDASMKERFNSHFCSCRFERRQPTNSMRLQLRTMMLLRQKIQRTL